MTPQSQTTHSKWAALFILAALVLGFGVGVGAERDFRLSLKWLPGSRGLFSSCLGSQSSRLDEADDTDE